MNRQRTDRSALLNGLRVLWGTVFVVTLVLAPLAMADTPHSAEGHWQGHIDLGDDRLAISIDLTRVNGRWVCEVDVPDAGFQDVPFAVRVSGHVITLKSDGAELLARLSDDGRHIEGRLIQGSEEMDFTVARNGDAQLTKIEFEDRDEIEAALTPVHTTVMSVTRQGPLMMLGVEVLINGYGPYELLLDTDNGYSDGVLMLNAGLADKLELEVTGEGEERTTSVEALTVADYVVAGVAANVIDMKDFFYDVDAPDGVLPLSLLSDYTVVVDLPKAQLTLGDAHLKPGRDGVVTIGRGEHGQPLFPIEMGGHAAQATVNLSIRSQLNLPPAYRDSLLLTSQPQRIGYVSNSEGEFEILGANLESTLHIGGHELALQSVRFSDIFKHVEIGFPMLENFVVAFDQSSGRALLSLSEARLDVRTQAAAVANLSEGRAVLRDAFNADPDKVRMVLILSPT